MCGPPDYRGVQLESRFKGSGFEVCEREFDQPSPLEFLTNLHCACPPERPPTPRCISGGSAARFLRRCVCN